MPAMDAGVDAERWPRPEPVRTARLRLDPLCAEDAAELAPLLDDEALHAFTGGRPAAPAELREQYVRQSTGISPDGSQGWLNWVVRLAGTGVPVGTVQATLERDRESGRTVADLAWVIVRGQQRRGYATEAAGGMARWLAAHGVDELSAHVHPAHAASERVATALGLAPTGEVVDGERRWSGSAQEVPAPPPGPSNGAES